jgi:Fe-S-cluster containining protein
VTDSFPCTSCGVCCTNIKTFPFAEEFALEDGSCKHLTKENKCGIYETRPDFCRMNKRAEKSVLGEQGYYKATSIFCNGAQERKGIPIEFRIKIEEI